MGTICCVCLHIHLYERQLCGLMLHAKQEIETMGEKVTCPSLIFAPQLSLLNVDFLHTIGRNLIILSEKLQLLCFLLLFVQQALKLL